MKTLQIETAIKSSDLLRLCILCIFLYPFTKLILNNAHIYSTTYNLFNDLAPYKTLFIYIQNYNI